MSHSFQGSIPSSTRKFYTMHIYGEEAGKKIPIKSLPEEFRNLALSQASLLFIYLLYNVTKFLKLIFLK